MLERNQKKDLSKNERETVPNVHIPVAMGYDYVIIINVIVCNSAY